jgi:16S rRNA (uracil1498-N3)-methyltransferase
MSVPHFLVTGPAADGASIELDRGEAKHARVRRLRRGEEVVVLDGRGWSAAAVIDTIDSRRVVVRIVRALPERRGESPLDLTLALALLKSDRFDWIVEKATELGVTRIRPFMTEHSLARPSTGRRDRWRQIALSAAKQCGRTVPPEIHPPVPFREALGDLDGVKYLFAEGGPGRAPLEANVAVASVSVIVGPEGGFTSEEVATASAADCQVVTLGPRILRAETAAITAVALCQHLFGDLR